MINTLVQYRGGGYSGCVWEWNFFFLDAQGKFIDIFSSGCDGITTQEQADDLVANQPAHVHFYDVTRESAWRELSKEAHPSLVMRVFDWFEKQGFDGAEPLVFCDVCDSPTSEPVYEDDAHPDYHLFCENCWNVGSCECGRWSDDIRKCGDEYLCPDCREYRDEQKLAEDQHDLLWASLATGTPDLFNEEMRWYFSGK